MAIAFVSLLTGRPVPSTTACTGEITLRGAVTAVGGIREKLLAAHRAGMTKCVPLLLLYVSWFHLSLRIVFREFSHFHSSTRPVEWSMAAQQSSLTSPSLPS